MLSEQSSISCGTWLNCDVLWLFRNCYIVITKLAMMNRQLRMNSPRPRSSSNSIAHSLDYFFSHPSKISGRMEHDCHDVLIPERTGGPTIPQTAMSAHKPALEAMIRLDVALLASKARYVWIRYGQGHYNIHVASMSHKFRPSLCLQHAKRATATLFHSMRS